MRTSAIRERPTVRHRLRAATAEAHAALEAELDLATQLRTRADLAAVLARFRGFFGPLEAALDTLLGREVMEGRLRVPDLDADLATLGLGAAAIASLPCCATAGALATPADAWGALYVTEGARLGGRIVARDLARRDIAHGLRFWSDAPASAPSWADFLLALEAAPDPALAERGALATFARLHAWMSAHRTAAG